MADTTNPVNPVASTTSTNTTTNNDLPVINLDALANQETQTSEEMKQSVDTTVASAQSAPEISQTTDTAPSLETTTTEVQINTESTTVEDPFEGLNIVLGEATSNEPGSETIKAAQSFVDPFLNPKKSEVSEVVPTEESQITGETTVVESATTETANSSSEPINLDAMLASVDSSTSVIAPSTDGLSDKKKKMIMIGSGVLGLIVLAAASYFVFSTMYPSGMGLTADISGDTQGTTATGSNTGTESLPDPVAAENVYQPDTTTTPEVDPNSVDNNSVEEEELPTTPAESFGKEDELPIGNNDTTAQNDGKPTDSTAQTSKATGDTLPSNVDNNKDAALQAIATNVDKAKQALALAKAKNDNESIKKIAIVLKDMRTLKADIEDGFESYSTEIEPVLTKSTSTIDAILTQLIGN